MVHSNIQLHTITTPTGQSTRNMVLLRKLKHESELDEVEFD